MIMGRSIKPDREPTNWSHWLLLSRLAARNGDRDLAAKARRRAEQLNPPLLDLR